MSWSNGDPLAGGGGIGSDGDLMAATGGKQQDDPLAVAQNGGVSSSDEGDMDGDGEDLDDDMMDRISSSPSIEDGASYNHTPYSSVAWPRRLPSLSPHLQSRSLIKQSFFPSVNHFTPALFPRHTNLHLHHADRSHHHRPLPDPNREQTDQSSETNDTVHTRRNRAMANSTCMRRGGLLLG